MIFLLTARALRVRCWRPRLSCPLPLPKDGNPNFKGRVINGGPDQYYNPAAFALPPAGTYGNVGKDVLVGPGLADVDMGFLKNTRIGERTNVQFRAEFFNLFNRANFNFPNLVVFSGVLGAFSPAAGRITATSTTSRQIQFALKLTW